MGQKVVLEKLPQNLKDIVEEGGFISYEYYFPSESYEYHDGENFYNRSGSMLRDVSDYDTSQEAYTPFGDE